MIKGWELICEVSRTDYNKLYERLDVKCEERGESFYQDLMLPVIKELDDKGLIDVLID